MLEAYDRSLRSDIERSGRLFASMFDQPLELHTAGEVPRLLQKGTPLNDRFDVVDAFTAKSGTVATILVRQGDDFLRTATSLKKEDGNRSTRNPARCRSSGAPGAARRQYLHRQGDDVRSRLHHPLHPGARCRRQGGRVFFVGLELTEGLKALKQGILAIKVGETGYVAALDAGKQKGVATIHPAKEGANLLAAKDSRGVEFVREMLDKKSGVIRYDWANPGESSPRRKVAVFDHYPAWNWVVVSTSYVEEISRGADAAVRDIAIMAVAIILAALASGFLATRAWVSRPLHEIVLAAERIAGGDLSSRLVADGGDEVGSLKRAIGTMAENLKTTIGDVRQAAATMLEQSTALVSSAQQVSHSSEVQRDAATGMAASVEEMSVSIEQVAQHARDAQRLSSGSGQAANNGAEVIQQAGGAMGQITGFVRQASTTVGELGRRSQDISEVVQVIREIAEQTNLLASTLPSRRRARASRDGASRWLPTKCANSRSGRRSRRARSAR
jgi:methyl-accepting chemotaxis protein